MSAGTLKLTNNSTVVVGTSTVFTTDLKPGDFITTTIGGVLYTLPVDTVTSNTAATLVSPFTGPTTTGAAWAAVPRKTMNQVTAELVNQSTAAIRALLAEKGNWAKFYTAPGDITMQFADNVAPVSGPGWQKMAGLVGSSQQVRGALPAAANLNSYGPTAALAGIWMQGTSNNAQPASNFPEPNAVGFLEVFAGGQWGGTQRYTVRNGNVYVRSLTASWNGVDGPWGDWSLVGVNSRPGYYEGDLNALVTPGTWSITGVATNGPVASGLTGICEVLLRSSANSVVQRFTAIVSGAAFINRTWQRTLSGTTWSSWEQQGAKVLNDLGLGVSSMSSVSGMDWNQFDFVSGQEFSVAASNMTNTPPGVDTTGWGSTPVCFNVIGVDGSIVTAECWLSHVTNSLFRRYQVRISGSKGSRIFAVRQIWTSADVIPVANGGTGATTPGGARSALQLGDSATKNVGTGAGTVAAGDDSRLVNAASAKGSSYTGVIDFLNNSTSGDFGESVIVRSAHGQTIGSEFVNNVIKVFANDGAFTRFQHRVTTYHAARIVVAPVAGGAATFEFAQTGNAVASGAWVNAGSDERIKDDITPIETPRDILMNIRAATWRYRHKGAEGRFGIGVIANDLGKYFPEAVINTGPRELDDGTVIDDVLAVEAGDSGAMVAVHHAVLQSLVEENRSQQLEIEALKSSMEELKKMVEELIPK
ncbi:MAG: pyocin knob domain-containing S74 family peptidase [Atlantibacter hermannii]|uniref:pyocin knob domain-containing S74 family peptidase n=3 Tax=Atlantibacter hermannii TaxID=565 RepID=UPI00290D15B2|nr:pyocin knob domain-containing S74 family peptidase [Atlantibacter hermannii]MDU7812670.1 pyocin knob domain-containing S74 family peptidase [Atlantibacter hermannii]